jgi:NAD+ synthase (glutamine-hydrolysing)
VTAATVDVDATRMNQARTASYQPNLDELPADCVSCGFTYPAVPPAPPQVAVAAWERSAHLKEEEFTRAVTLALFDYMRKSRSRGFVISLSGGADSTACSLLVSLMAQLALRELGAEAFLDRLGYMRDQLGSARSVRDVVRALLLTVYQATENSSLTTRDAAAIIADTIGAEFAELAVGGIVKDYVAMIGRTFGRPLAWDRDDIALQNIQARVRAPGAWLLANLRGALLVSTSNRSEAAVGYATMDGDTCGGISPVAGIDKAFLLRWLRWMETEGMDGLAPVPELSAVTRLAPTAELRPPKMVQTDEADLMPYPVLDAIERAAIRDKRSPEECWRVLRATFAEYPPTVLATWTDRFFRLWCRNQWKRERYAPSFHLDDENLDPKTWCRFPILSGGYERELAELRATVEREFPAPAEASV